MGGPQKRKREEKGGGAARRGREGKEGAQEISKGNEADNQATVDKLHTSKVNRLLTTLALCRSDNDVSIYNSSW